MKRPNNQRDQSRSIPLTKRIGEVKCVADLVDGERAYPESNSIYRLVTSIGKNLPGTEVLFIQRHGDVIYAYGTHYQPVIVMGPGAERTWKVFDKKRHQAYEKRAAGKNKSVPKPH